MKESGIELIIEDWGHMPYREAWQLQKQRFNEMIEGTERVNAIFCVEHPPVYTLGFHGNAANLIASEARLTSLGAECIRIERGGDITYHGPGQLVVYPVINLRDFRLGVKKYVSLLERAVIDVLAEWGIAASCNDDAIGVWIDWGGLNPRKICAIGVKISHGITMHGLALNVNTDLSAFSLINPCGITDKGVTSMVKELGALLDMTKVKDRLSTILYKKLISEV